MVQREHKPSYTNLVGTKATGYTHRHADRNRSNTEVKGIWRTSTASLRLPSPLLLADTTKCLAGKPWRVSLKPVHIVENHRGNRKVYAKPIKSHTRSQTHTQARLASSVLRLASRAAAGGAAEGVSGVHSASKQSSPPQGGIRFIMSRRNKIKGRTNKSGGRKERWKAGRKEGRQSASGRKAKRNKEKKRRKK
ncbi:hypothetical protein E2C01_038004 [Portunus trituberculatus]|uniref:Uncharacterized protein n=1 Tax=Portunus trituberculatus TaxID=210409 RepID=A0A5B7FB19_PORTR|nr:hypothetical protein [Portunus trituberculatus]